MNKLIDLFAALAFVCFSAYVSSANAAEQTIEERELTLAYAVVCQNHCTSITALDYSDAILEISENVGIDVSAAYEKGNDISSTIVMLLNSGDVHAMASGVRKINEVQDYLLGKRELVLPKE